MYSGPRQAIKYFKTKKPASSSCIDALLAKTGSESGQIFRCPAVHGSASDQAPQDSKTCLFDLNMDRFPGVQRSTAGDQVLQDSKTCLFDLNMYRVSGVQRSTAAQAIKHPKTQKPASST